MFGRPRKDKQLKNLFPPKEKEEMSKLVSGFQIQSGN